MHRQTLFAGALLALTLSGCASYHPSYEQAFSQKDALNINHKVFVAPQAATMTAAELVLINQGFTIARVDKAGGIITAKGALMDPEDHAVSWLLSATVLTVPQTAGKTTVSISATEQKVRHQETRTWWHLLFIIPLFPTATHYRTVVRRTGVVRNKTFYTSFFSDLGKALQSPAKTLAKPIPAPEPTKAASITQKPST